VLDVKGQHAFAPTLATAPSTQFDEVDEVELESTGRGTGSAGARSSTIVNHGTNMDVDIGEDCTITFSKQNGHALRHIDS